MSHSDPEDIVRVSGVARAAEVLLVAGGVDDDGVLEGACNAISHQPSRHPYPNYSQTLRFQSSLIVVTYQGG